MLNFVCVIKKMSKFVKKVTEAVNYRRERIQNKIIPCLKNQEVSTQLWLKVDDNHEFSRDEQFLFCFEMGSHYVA